MSDTPETVIRLAALPAGKTHHFKLQPDADARESIAARQKLSALRKLSFSGKLIPEGKRDWRLQATLGASLVQPCVVTLEPVNTRVDETVTRLYMAGLARADDEELEMPEDDSVEPMPDELDLNAVMEEALALYVPLYPRAQDAELADASVAPPGVTPLSDEDTKPFAGLAELKNKLGGGGDQGPDGSA